MQTELLNHSDRAEGFATANSKRPLLEPVSWVRVALSGLLVAGLVLLSSWLFRG
jgi:hypothetical protein